MKITPFWQMIILILLSGAFPILGVLMEGTWYKYPYILFSYALFSGLFLWRFHRYMNDITK